jgi:transposase InsO family protein
MFRLTRSVPYALGSSVRLAGDLTLDGLRFLGAIIRSRSAVSAEILFLRKQLAFYQEHQIRPRRLSDSARFSLVFWSRLFDWKEALVIVKPETLIGWHRKGFKLFWKWKCRVGRPRLPGNIRQLIVRMVRENPTWGEERVAAELSVKLLILVSPRTVRSYWPSPSTPQGARRTSSQHWRTFVHNHAESLVACDFLVAVTARFRVLCVFVVMEVGSRQILYYNVTAHPTAGWTVQQFREAFPSDHNYRFLIHDRDSIFSTEVDEELKSFGLTVLRTPVQAPKANAFCERLIGTVRRECLDYVIPLSEKHLRKTLREWVAHYNQGRPHSALGPGIPADAKERLRHLTPHSRRHELPADSRITTREILGGLHHEYELERAAA